MHFVFTVLLLTLAASFSSWADIKDDLGYTQLQSELGASLPLGTASVFQVEAEIPQGSNQWIADDTDAEFSGKTITDLSIIATPASGTSGHATGVGKKFYGTLSSLSPGITDVGAYSVNGWLVDQTAPGGSFNASTLSFVGVPIATDRRISNHSWVASGLNDTSGNFSPALTASWLRHHDWFSDVDELIQIYGANNGGSVVLLATALNGIVAGITAGTSANQVIALDSTYIAGRPAIHLVTPETTVSSSAPNIASAAALLIDAAASNPAWSESSTTNRNGTVIYNAERSETIKAALMAGASRRTFNTTNNGNISDYRDDPANQTDNGLDWRYGAGQLNVYNSYTILAAGEKPSMEDDGSLDIGFQGFDHDASFGGSAGSNTIATYDLGFTSNNTTDINISLVWHLHNFTSIGAGTFNESSTLYNLDVELIDVTNGNSVVAQSTSAIDNTENIWHTLEPNTQYQIQVVRGSGQGNFNWDYSIAWFTTSALTSTQIPVPAWTYLILASILLMGMKRIR